MTPSPKCGSGLSTVIKWFKSNLKPKDRPHVRFNLWMVGPRRWNASVSTFGGGVGGNAPVPEDAILAACMNHLTLAERNAQPAWVETSIAQSKRKPKRSK